MKLNDYLIGAAGVLLGIVFIPLLAIADVGQRLRTNRGPTRRLRSSIPGQSS